ncbi:RYR2 [Lepeophtheirus salmonis]|uniref:RYR2 n=1 Tax=Lepeophtheirus salmonis TaxID=72036 RepID=A0A817FEF5_LEPSM|nr:RYR2 [Lepeophtheirus salmonis]CAG9478502.1 RYR2 [Lepeophtheirus salmonis]
MTPYSPMVSRSLVKRGFVVVEGSVIPFEGTTILRPDMVAIRNNGWVYYRPYNSTSPFDPSMSALPIIAKQNRQASDCSPANRERDRGFRTVRETVKISLDLKKALGGKGKK